ncbi:MAG: OB-fold nucleic acid binding domain-containing protein [Candidatus Aenigmatarchaeota archaeon]
MPERMTARKVRIAEITNGRWVKNEGLEPSFVVTPSGEQVSRARIMGTVVSKFVSEDENFASITVDDSTDTIRVKTFKTVKPLDVVQTGDIVDVIGKVREYNAEVYIMPEIVRKIEDPNLELLRRLELIAKARKLMQSPIPQFISAKEDRANLKKKVLEVIESDKSGVSYSKILEMVNAPETQVESVVNELLDEGICYEPTPGKIRKI